MPKTTKGIVTTLKSRIAALEKELAAARARVASLEALAGQNGAEQDLKPWWRNLSALGTPFMDRAFEEGRKWRERDRAKARREAARAEPKRRKSA